MIGLKAKSPKNEFVKEQLSLNISPPAKINNLLVLH